MGAVFTGGTIFEGAVFNGGPGFVGVSQGTVTKVVVVMVMGVTTGAAVDSEGQ